MSVSETFKRSVITGVALLAPLVVTLVAIQLLFGWLRGVLNPIIQNTGLVSLTGNVEFLAEVGALVILVVGIAVVGYLAQRSVGVGVFDLLERLVGLVPMVNVVYSGVRQVSDALMNRQSRYESVVLVEYPREGLYALGFVTSESPESVVGALGDDARNVYIPNSPNPTQGRLLMVPAADVTDVDMSVSRAIRLLVTTGIAENQEELEEFQQGVTEELVDEDVPVEDG